MSFLWPDLLWLLALVPVVAAAYIMVQRRRQRYALRYASVSLVKQAVGPGPGRRRHIPPILFLIGLAAMLLAVARPTAVVRAPSYEGTVILTIDVSGSMKADDIKPDRLSAAKAAAETFVDKQPSNVRIGVVSFSDNPAVVQAPTKDRQAIRDAIERLTPQRGTGIGLSIVTSLNAIFEEGDGSPVITTPPFGRRDMTPTPEPSFTPVPPGSDRSAAIVLLSDGESNVGPSPVDTAGQAADRGVRIFTIGLGSPQGTVVSNLGRSMRVRLDEQTLKDIAEKTDGLYFRAGTETDLRDIYKNLSTRLVMKPERTELTAWFTGAAGLFLLAAAALSLFWFHRLP